MCTVDVLLIADVMRRSSFSVRPSARSVCRRLFPDECPSAREISERLKRSEEELNREVTKKWNFNFQTETPLPGRYQWVRVGGPASSSSASENAPVRQTTAVVAEVADSSSASAGLQKSGDRVSAFTQPKITDFMNHKKRHLTGDSILSPKSKISRLNNNKTSPPKTSKSKVAATATKASNPPST